MDHMNYSTDKQETRKDYQNTTGDTNNTYTQDSPYQQNTQGQFYQGTQNQYQQSTQGNPYQQNAYGNPYRQNTQSNPYQQYQNTAKQNPPKKGSMGAFIGKCAVGAACFGLVAALVFTGVSFVGTKVLGVGGNSASSGTDGKVSYSISGTQTNTETQTETLTDVSAVAEEVMPSIVAITNMGTTVYQSFFGSQSYQTQSAGSGIIVGKEDKYLYIASNNHVVADADTLTVQFCDNSTVSAELTGTDPADDLAVVQVELASIAEDTLKTIKVATIGDSDKVKVGEPTIAIGNALGYGQSVTTGIVSALGRTVSTSDSTTGQTVTNTNLIQTDAAINPGNSGGALLNAAGEVIGINSVKYSETSVEGIGYAIPMADAFPIIQSLISHDELPQNAYLGIVGQDVSSNVSSVYNMPRGVYISQVVEGSAAEKGGLRQGDIITELDGKSMTSMSVLKAYLAGLKEGDKVTLTYSRMGDGGYTEQSVEITLGGQTSVTENKKN